MARDLNTVRNAPQPRCSENDKDAMAELQDTSTCAPRAAHGSQGSGCSSSCRRQVQADDRMMDGKAMMNLGNRQIFSYHRDLVNTSEHAFLINPGMNCNMPREASAFLAYILLESS